MSTTTTQTTPHPTLSVTAINHDTTASSARDLLPNGLPSINRFITTHNPTGKAIFNTSIPTLLPFHPLPGNIATFGLAYATSQTPVSFTSDIDTYTSYLTTPPGLTIPGGTVLRVVDFAPNQESVMHRTVSLDYGVVLEGEVDLVLDSGEVRTMRRGDVAVQRGTNHAWRNRSGGVEGRWARMLFVLQESEPLVVAGEVLGEELGGLHDGVKASG